MSEVPGADAADAQEQDDHAAIPEQGGADLDRLERDLGDGDATESSEGDGSTPEK